MAPLTTDMTGAPGITGGLDLALTAAGAAAAVLPSVEPLAAGTPEVGTPEVVAPYAGAALVELEVNHLAHPAAGARLPTQQEARLGLAAAGLGGHDPAVSGRRGGMGVDGPDPLV